MNITALVEYGVQCSRDVHVMISVLRHTLTMTTTHSDKIRMEESVKVVVLYNDKGLEKLTVTSLHQLLSERGVQEFKRKKKPELLTLLKCSILKEELVKVRGIIRS